MTFIETYDMIQNLKERFNEKGYATKYSIEGRVS